MMADKREDILSTLFTELSTVDGLVTFVRNRGLMDQDRRPVCILLDGSEALRSTVTQRTGDARLAPHIMTMRPQIWVILKNAKPENENVGKDLNRFRIAILEKLTGSLSLAAAIGATGAISLEGVITDLESGKLVEGQMLMQLAIQYVLNI